MDNGAKKKLKPENLIPLLVEQGPAALPDPRLSPAETRGASADPLAAGMRIRVTGLTAQPALNGLEGAL